MEVLIVIGAVIVLFVAAVRHQERRLRIFRLNSEAREQMEAQWDRENRSPEWRLQVGRPRSIYWRSYSSGPWDEWK